MFIACYMLHTLHCTALRMLHCMPHQLCARTLGGGVARCCRKLSDALVQRIRLATRLRWCKQQMPYNTHRATCNAHRAKYNTHRATCNRTTYSTHRAACNSHRATYNRATLQRALCSMQHTPCSKQSCNTTHIMQRATQDMPSRFFIAHCTLWHKHSLLKAHCCGLAVLGVPQHCGFDYRYCGVPYLPQCTQVLTLLPLGPTAE